MRQHRWHRHVLAPQPQVRVCRNRAQHTTWRNKTIRWLSAPPVCHDCGHQTETFYSTVERIRDDGLVLLHRVGHNTFKPAEGYELRLPDGTVIQRYNTEADARRAGDAL